MPKRRIVSLCSGYGGLEAAIGTVIGGDLAYVADIDPAACAVLAHRFPGVPNLGDIKTVDWTSLGAVDILGGGYPCQPFSQAGRRLGTADPRHLWPHFVTAIGKLRPGMVVLENVHGHLTLGFDTVLADLAALGYDAEWIVVTAHAAGACHRRARLFIVAFPAGRHIADEPVAVIRDGIWFAPRESLFGALPFTGSIPPSGRMAAGRVYAAGDGPTEMAAGLLKTPTAQLAVNGGSQHPDKRRAGGHGPTLADQVEHELLPAAALLPTPTAARVGSRMDTQFSGDGRERPNKLGWAIGSLLPTPTVADSRNSRNATAGRSENSTAHQAGTTLSDVFWDGQGTPLPVAAQQLAGSVDWGPYEAAIRRWEAETGRPAPRPTVPGKAGERLNPELPEWMMGLPSGWITGVPGLTRNDMLKVAGNGVVPQQAALALMILLPRAGFTTAEAGAA